MALYGEPKEFAPKADAETLRHYQGMPPEAYHALDAALRAADARLGRLADAFFCAPCAEAWRDEDPSSLTRTCMACGEPTAAREKTSARRKEDAYKAMEAFCHRLDTNTARATLMVADREYRVELDRILTLLRYADGTLR